MRWFRLYGDLRAAGNAISVERVLLDNGKRVAKYRMPRAAR